MPHVRSTPPRPAAAVRVGVAGDTLTTLRGQGVDVGELRVHVREVLETIQRITHTLASEWGEVYGGPPILYLICSLRDGADQIVAGEALGLGYTLQAPLPCPAPLYAAALESARGPIHSDPRADFERLVSQAKSIQVLDGSRTTPPDGSSVIAVGRTVLRHADVLLAVWDGESAAAPGGTRDVVEQARAWHVPIVMMKPQCASRWGLERPPGPAAPVDLAGLIRDILAPPSPPVPSPDVTSAAGSEPGLTAAQPVAHGLRQYLDTRLRSSLGGLYAIVVACVAWERPPVPAALLGRSSIARARADWHALWTRPTQVDAEIVRPLTHALEEFYVWAEGLGHQFGTLHRDASTAPYVLAPLAVLCALIAHFVPAPSWTNPTIWAFGWPIGEVVTLVGVLFFFVRAVRRQYHDRWLDYRSLAEQLRQLAFLWPLGRAVPPIRFDVEAEEEATRFAWIEWYVRAVARRAGLFPGTLTPERLATVRQVLEDRFVRHQCKYHDRTAERFGRVYERLHVLTVVAFAAALVFAVCHLARHLFLPDPLAHHWQQQVDDAIGIAAIVLPAVGTAVHGFLSQGDFWNLAHRSRRACAHLDRLAATVAKTPTTIEALGDVAEVAAAAMCDEVVYWRVFARLRPPALV